MNLLKRLSNLGMLTAALIGGAVCLDESAEAHPQDGYQRQPGYQQQTGSHPQAWRGHNEAAVRQMVEQQRTRQLQEVHARQQRQMAEQQRLRELQEVHAQQQRIRPIQAARELQLHQIAEQQRIREFQEAHARQLQQAERGLHNSQASIQAQIGPVSVQLNLPQAAPRGRYPRHR